MAQRVKKTEEVKDSPAVVLVNRKVSSVMSGSNGVLIDFKSKEEVEKALKALVKKHTKRIDVLQSLSTLNNVEIAEAKEIRSELRSARYTLQKVLSSNKKVLNTMKTNHELTISELIAIVNPAEDLIDLKIKSEEDRRENEKAEAERLKKERIEAIENRITDAGTEFAKLISEAKKTRNWDLFEAYYLSFEESLETLEELAFEGQEVLDDALMKKNDAIKAIEEEDRLKKQQEEQEKREREQNERQEELNKIAAKAEQDKNRTKEMFSLGFIFNGESFLKNETVYSEEEILAAPEDKYRTITSLWKKAIEEENKAEEKKKQRKEEYLELVSEDRELELNTGSIDENSLQDSDVAKLKTRIENFKTEKGRIEEENRIEEEKKAANELKNQSKEIIKEIEKWVDVLLNELDPEEFTNNNYILVMVEKFKIKVLEELKNLKLKTNNE